jgi:hypothetical protein
MAHYPRISHLESAQVISAGVVETINASFAATGNPTDNWETMDQREALTMPIDTEQPLHLLAEEGRHACPYPDMYRSAKAS